MIEAVEYATNAEFLDMAADVDSPILISALAERVTRDQDAAVKAAAIMCFDDARRNFHGALRFRAALERLPEDQLANAPLPVHAYLVDEPGLASLLESETVTDDAFPVHTFGSVEQNATYEEVVRPVLRELAARIHVAYEQIRTEAGHAGPQSQASDWAMRSGTTAGPSGRQ